MIPGRKVFKVVGRAATTVPISECSSEELAYIITEDKWNATIPGAGVWAGFVGTVAGRRGRYAIYSHFLLHPNAAAVLVEEVTDKKLAAELVGGGYSEVDFAMSVTEKKDRAPGERPLGELREAQPLSTVLDLSFEDPFGGRWGHWKVYAGYLRCHLTTEEHFQTLVAEALGWRPHYSEWKVAVEAFRAFRFGSYTLLFNILLKAGEVVSVKICTLLFDEARVADLSEEVADFGGWRLTAADVASARAKIRAVRVAFPNSSEEIVAERLLSEIWGKLPDRWRGWAADAVVAADLGTGQEFVNILSMAIDKGSGEEQPALSEFKTVAFLSEEDLRGVLGSGHGEAPAKAAGLAGSGRLSAEDVERSEELLLDGETVYAPYSGRPIRPGDLMRARLACSWAGRGRFVEIMSARFGWDRGSPAMSMALQIFDAIVDGGATAARVSDTIKDVLLGLGKVASMSVEAVVFGRRDDPERVWRLPDISQAVVTRTILGEARTVTIADLAFAELTLRAAQKAYGSDNLTNAVEAVGPLGSGPEWVSWCARLFEIVATRSERDVVGCLEAAPGEALEMLRSLFPGEELRRRLFPEKAVYTEKAREEIRELHKLDAREALDDKTREELRRIVRELHPEMSPEGVEQAVAILWKDMTEPVWVPVGPAPMDPPVPAYADGPGEGNEKMTWREFLDCGGAGLANAVANPLGFAVHFEAAASLEPTVSRFDSGRGERVPQNLDRPSGGEDQPLVAVSSWLEMKNAMVLKAVNGALHFFGLVIVLQVSAGGDTVTGVFPARTAWRGFSGDLSADGDAHARLVDFANLNYRWISEDARRRD